ACDPPPPPAAARHPSRHRPGRRVGTAGASPLRPDPLGLPGPLRVDAPLAREHRQRTLRRPAVLALNVAVLRRAELLREHLPAQGHQGRADRDRQADGVHRLGESWCPRWQFGLAEHLAQVPL
ncbi:MAG: PROBABLE RESUSCITATION-PROMOTING FACTOR RPFE, partial [uncultured Nocardioidaceae bacterium]